MNYLCPNCNRTVEADSDSQTCVCGHVFLDLTKAQSKSVEDISSPTITLAGPETGSMVLSDSIDRERTDFKLPHDLGKYELLELVGEGGMGKRL